jgi:ketosteroid isomerase-like protein
MAGLFRSREHPKRQETDHKVQICAGGKAAFVTYLFAVTFTMDDQKQAMQGRDMFFLVKEGRGLVRRPVLAGTPASWIRRIMNGSGNSCRFQIVE